MLADRPQQLPRPLWKVDPKDKAARWDRKSVDRALDAESAIPATVEAQEQAWDRALASTDNPDGRGEISGWSE